MDNKEESNTPAKKEKKHSVKFKRNRSSRACEVCHSRKVRCDATLHIPCTNCLTFGCECKFPERKERKNASKKRKLEAAKLQDSNAPVPGGGVGVKLEHSSPSLSLAATAAANNNGNNVKPSPLVGAGSTTAGPSNTTTGSSSKRRNEPLAAISARSARIDSQKLVKKNTNTFSYHGRSSTAKLLTDNLDRDPHLKICDFIPPSLRSTMEKTRLNLDTVQMEILRLRGAFHLPEKHLCDDLINSFFEHIYPMEPIINKQIFMEDYQNGTVSLLLLQSVLLAGSRMSTNPLIFDSDGSNYLASATFYQRAKALYDANFETDEVAVVQSLILFSRFWEGVDDILGNSFYWTRIAIIVAQGYGFNRNLARASKYTEERVRICKIIWWDLYIKDMSVSVAFGRPRSILLEDCDVPMLQLEDFTPDLSRKDAEAFIQMIRLSEIMSIVLQEQYSVRAEKFKRHRDQLVITHCDMIMSSWRNNLPPALQYSPTKHDSLPVSILNLYYYYAVCLAHRSTMVRSATLNGKQYPSEGIVFKASRIIADIVSKLLKSGDIKYCHAMTIPIFFIAAMTFLCHMDSQNSAIAKSAKIGFAICDDALNEVGRNHMVASLIRYELDKFIKDPKAREKLVSSLARKNEVQQNNAGTTPAPTPAPEEALPQAPVPPQNVPPPQRYVNDIAPSPAVYQTPPQQQQPQRTPVMNMQQGEAVGLNVGAPPALPLQVQQQPMPPQGNIQVPTTEVLEFPDLYLFTNNIPSNSAVNFDPSELFPEKESRSDTASDSNHYNEFYMNLPEFDFQSFNNTMGFQGLANFNTYLGDVTSNDSSQSQPNIRSFAN